MTDLNKLILEKSHGGAQLHPDEQRKYLETFAERLILTASLEDCYSPELKKHFPDILRIFSEKYSPIFLKISPNLDDAIQIFFMKEGQKADYPTTIVSHNCENSPFGLVMHTDHALNLEETDIKKVFPDFFKNEEIEKAKKKKSFWQHLFGQR